MLRVATIFSLISILTTLAFATSVLAAGSNNNTTTTAVSTTTVPVSTTTTTAPPITNICSAVGLTTAPDATFFDRVAAAGPTYRGDTFSWGLALCSPATKLGYSAPSECATPVFLAVFGDRGTNCDTGWQFSSVVEPPRVTAPGSFTVKYASTQVGLIANATVNVFCTHDPRYDFLQGSWGIVESHVEMDQDRATGATLIVMNVRTYGCTIPLPPDVPFPAPCAPAPASSSALDQSAGVCRDSQCTVCPPAGVPGATVPILPCQGMGATGFVHVECANMSTAKKENAPLPLCFTYTTGKQCDQTNPADVDATSRSFVCDTCWRVSPSESYFWSCAGQVGPEASVRKVPCGSAGCETSTSGCVWENATLVTASQCYDSQGAEHHWLQKNFIKVRGSIVETESLVRECSAVTARVTTFSSEQCDPAHKLGSAIVEVNQGCWENVRLTCLPASNANGNNPTPTIVPSTTTTSSPPHNDDDQPSYSEQLYKFFEGITPQHVSWNPSNTNLSSWYGVEAVSLVPAGPGGGAITVYDVTIPSSSSYAGVVNFAALRKSFPLSSIYCSGSGGVSGGHIAMDDLPATITFIEMSGCGVTGQASFTDRTRFTQLLVINFTHNQLIGPLDLSGFGDLITYIDLSHNAITGEFRSEQLHSLKLTVIDLSFNKLTGSPALSFPNLGISNVYNPRRVALALNNNPEISGYLDLYSLSSSVSELSVAQTKLYGAIDMTRLPVDPLNLKKTTLRYLNIKNTYISLAIVSHAFLKTLPFFYDSAVCEVLTVPGSSSSSDSSSTNPVGVIPDGVYCAQTPVVRSHSLNTGVVFDGNVLEVHMSSLYWRVEIPSGSRFVFDTATGYVFNSTSWMHVFTSVVTNTNNRYKALFLTFDVDANEDSFVVNVRGIVNHNEAVVSFRSSVCLPQLERFAVHPQEFHFTHDFFDGDYASLRASRAELNVIIVQKNISGNEQHHDDDGSGGGGVLGGSGIGRYPGVRNCTLSPPRLVWTHRGADIDAALPQDFARCVFGNATLVCGLFQCVIAATGKRQLYNDFVELAFRPSKTHTISLLLTVSPLYRFLFPPNKYCKFFSQNMWGVLDVRPTGISLTIFQRRVNKTNNNQNETTVIVTTSHTDTVAQCTIDQAPEVENIGGVVSLIRAEVSSAALSPCVAVFSPPSANITALQLIPQYDASHLHSDGVYFGVFSPDEVIGTDSFRYFLYPPPAWKGWRPEMCAVPLANSILESSSSSSSSSSSELPLLRFCAQADRSESDLHLHIAHNATNLTLVNRNTRQVRSCVTAAAWVTTNPDEGGKLLNASEQLLPALRECMPSFSDAGLQFTAPWSQVVVNLQPGQRQQGRRADRLVTFTDGSGHTLVLRDGCDVPPSVHACKLVQQGSQQAPKIATATTATTPRTNDDGNGNDGSSNNHLYKTVFWHPSSSTSSSTSDASSSLSKSSNLWSTSFVKPGEAFDPAQLLLQQTKTQQQVQSCLGTPFCLPQNCYAKTSVAESENAQRSLQASCCLSHGSLSSLSVFAHVHDDSTSASDGAARFPPPRASFFCDRNVGIEDQAQLYLLVSTTTSNRNNSSNAPQEAATTGATNNATATRKVLLPVSSAGLTVLCSPCIPFLIEGAYATPVVVTLLSALKTALITIFMTFVVNKRIAPCLAKLNTFLVVALLPPMTDAQVEHMRQNVEKAALPTEIPDNDFFDQLKFLMSPSAAAGFSVQTNNDSNIQRQEAKQQKEDERQEAPLLLQSPRDNDVTDDDADFVPTARMLDAGEYRAFFDEVYVPLLTGHAKWRPARMTSQVKKTIAGIARECFESAALVVVVGVVVNHSDSASTVELSSAIGGDDDDDDDGDDAPEKQQRQTTSLAADDGRGGNDKTHHRVDNKKLLGIIEGHRDELDRWDLEYIMLESHSMTEQLLWTPPWELVLEIILVIVHLLSASIDIAATQQQEGGAGAGAGGGKTPLTSFEKFELIYFRVFAGSSPLLLLSNCLIQILHVSNDAVSRAFLAVTLFLLAPPLLVNVIPGALMYPMVSAPVAIVGCVMYGFARRAFSRAVSWSWSSVLVRVAYRTLLTFIVTLLFQFCYDYFFLFVVEKQSYLDVIRVDFERRRLACSLWVFDTWLYHSLSVKLDQMISFAPF